LSFSTSKNINSLSLTFDGHFCPIHLRNIKLTITEYILPGTASVHAQNGLMLYFSNQSVIKPFPSWWPNIVEISTCQWKFQLVHGKWTSMKLHTTVFIFGCSRVRNNNVKSQKIECPSSQKYFSVNQGINGCCLEITIN
jgi:hypothetical protein